MAFSIIKIYLYFNQIDDYDFIDLINNKKYNLKNKNIEGITEIEKEEKDDKNKEELKEKEKENDHFINIKMCGVSSVGKSTFINCI